MIDFDFVCFLGLIIKGIKFKVIKLEIFYNIIKILIIFKKILNFMEKSEKQEMTQVKQPEKKDKKQKKQKKIVEKEILTQEEQIKKQLNDSINDFSQIDFRVGQLIQCWVHPNSTNLYCTKVNIGTQIREIGTGLQQHVPIQSMKGQILVMSNIKARKLADFMSNGMIMAVEDSVTKKFEMISPKGKIGQRAVLQGYEEKFSQLPSEQFNQKKKILQKCLPKFKTDIQGFATFAGVRLLTSEGYIKCKTVNGSIS